MTRAPTARVHACATYTHLCMSKPAETAAASHSALIPNRWDNSRASTLNPQELLLYRSNLLGSDARITNFGGGNTSAKIPMSDPLTGETVFAHDHLISCFRYSQLTGSADPTQ